MLCAYHRRASCRVPDAIAMDCRVYSKVAVQSSCTAPTPCTSNRYIHTVALEPQLS